jgi:hypothetical protein
MWTPQYTAPARHWIQACKTSFSFGDIIYHIRFASKKIRKKAEELISTETENNQQRYNPEIPCNISPEVYRYNI